MKDYIKWMAFVAITILVFGFLAPWLISAKSNELVVLGIGTVVVYIGFVYKFSKG